MGTKMIKDPVHGYIKIQDDYMKNIIDSCEFQRLRNIRQTSYECLYPASSHSRFIHSLGVYYLGAKAFAAFRHNVERQEDVKDKTEKIKWDDLKHTFELACLLHDVGHTPFSHRGEGFLLFDEEVDEFGIMKTGIGKTEAQKINALYNELLRTLKNKLKDSVFNKFLTDFAKTIKGSKVHVSGKEVAKPHEIMSVIVAIDTYEEILNLKNVDYDLFARMILGICYEDFSNVKKGVNNALIQLLNSSIIDVDRLDYIIRDTQMSGLDSTSIDIERLLESVTLIYDRQACTFNFGYMKNALSTIVNVVLAHDAERRWIQAHPIVMYESFLVKKCINAVETRFKANDGTSIFQKQSFTASGVELQNGLKLRLMNDGDFIFLMKQIHQEDENGDYIKEYLSRDKRRSPIWKSEAEFRVLLNSLSKSQQEILMDIFAAPSEKDKDNSIGSVLNSSRIEELEEEIKRTQEETGDDDDFQNTNLIRKRQLFWLKKLESFCVSRGMDFNIYNQKTEAFRSKINSLSKLGVKIWYGQFKKHESIKEVLELYNTNEESGQKKTESGVPIRLFYLYIRKETDKFNMEDFVTFLKQTLEEYEKEFLSSHTK